jgi:hypothetical protein
MLGGAEDLATALVDATGPGSIAGKKLPHPGKKSSKKIYRPIL